MLHVIPMADDRIVAVRVSGRIDAHAGSIASGAVTAAVIATDAIDAASIAANALNGKGDWSTHDAAAVLTAFQNDQDYGLLLSNVGDILTDTGTTLPGQISALNDLSAAQVRTEADAALVAIHLDHLLAVDYDPASPPGAATALLNELVESDGGVARYTANALEQAPTGSGASVDAIADAVWDEPRSGHTTAGSFGEGVGVADKAGYSLSSSGLSQVTAWSVDITGTITGSLTGSVGSVASAITLPSIPAGWITAAGIAASALDGKGDWSTHSAAAVLTAFQNDQDYGQLLSNVSDILTDTGTTLPALFPSNFGSMAITAAGVVSADIQRINNIELIGTGQIGDLFRV